MQHHLTQADLVAAVEHYLNDKLLKEPVTVKSVRADHQRFKTVTLAVVVETRTPEPPEGAAHLDGQEAVEL